ncbi:MAG TPA: long-chain fatty acid--CoA ligase [Aquifex aeolicus]|nr:long-chain fatty acid--CoA ligase [Aquifex aeolicus]
MEFLKDFRKIALIYKDSKISYSELIENVKSYATLIDILPDERVAIISENRPEWIYAFFGIWKRGGIVVPIDFMSTPEEIKYILEDSSPRIILCSDTTFENVKKATEGLKVEVINFDRIVPPAPWKGKISRDEEDIAVLPYTSGTTGNPKGVMLTYKNIISNIEGVARVGIADENDITLAILPFHHMYPLMTTLLLPLYLGATITFLDKLTPEDILDKFQKYRITILIGVPRLYQLFHRRIMEQIEKKKIAKILFKLMEKVENQKLRRKVFSKVHEVFGGNIKYMVSGGAKLPLEVAKDFTTLGFTVIEGYGLTETSPIISFNPPDRIKLGSVGIPIEGIQVMTTDEGEIVVRGDNVMKGYWKKTAETEKVIIDGWFYTGDLGYIDEEGYIFITGRKKEIIVLGSGKNIFPEEIENKILEKAPFIKEVGVFERGGKLYALVHPDLEKAKSLKIANLHETIKWEVIDQVNRELPEWKRIIGFKIIETELPKTRLGKLRRFLLPELYEKAGKIKERQEETDFTIFETEEGKIIKEFLEKLTKRDIHPFNHLEIDLGLDSLAKVELLGFLETTFGLSLSEEELAKNIVVRDLIEFVRNKRGKVSLREVSWKDIFEKTPAYKLYNFPFIYNFGRNLLKLYFKLYHGVDVRGVENLPEPPFIIAPNHQSYLDAFAIASVLPKNIAEKTYFLGEEKYFKKFPASLFGKLAHVITVNVNRGLKESLQKTAYALKSGKVVVIFPEGARTRTGDLMEFKKGVSILSKELQVPIVPVAIDGAYDAWSIYDKFPKPRKIKIMFGRPIGPDAKSYDEITKEVQDWVKNMFLFLRKEK